MKKILLSPYLIIGFLLMFYTSVTAQKNQIKMFIKYDFEHLADTTKKEEPIKKPMYLYIGEESSYYTTFPLERSLESGSIPFGLDESDLSDALVNIYTPFKSPQELQIIAMIGQPYKIYPKRKNNITWDITNEEREIGGYKCYKATGEVEGRKYEAWFTEEIPYAIGPWKLNGLPGAILEAKDFSNEVRFFYAGLDIVKDNIALIEIDKINELPYEKYIKGLENSKADKLGSLLASLPPGAQIEFKAQDGRKMSQEEAEALMKQSEKQKPKYQLNNPVERFHKS